MRVKLLLVSALALPGLVACGAQKVPPADRYASIYQYYANCTYVAENSTPQEIMQFAVLLQGTTKKQAQPPSDDPRASKVYAAMAATLGTLLEPDPGIVRLPALGPLFQQYFFSFTPLDIVASDADSVSVRVARTSTIPLAQPAQPAVSTPGAVVKPYAPGAFSTTEVDEWVKVDGRWRLKLLHAYLVRG